MAVKHIIRWGILWCSKNKKDGISEHILCRDFVPALFVTRQDARSYRESRYGYLRNRPDLRAEPFGFRMPRVVRLRISLERF